MTEFPELQQALVDAARRRHGRAPRTWRLVRPVLVTGACAAAVAAVLMLSTSAPDDEQPAAPAVTPADPPAAPGVTTGDPLEQYYGVFRRPASDADALPNVQDIRNGLGGRDGAAFDPTKARLVVEDGALQVFVAGAQMQGRPSICVFLFEDRRTDRSACTLLAPHYEPGGPEVTGGSSSMRGGEWEVTGGSWAMRGGEGELFVAAVADGVDEVVLTFADDSTQRLAARDNAVYARLERRPVSFAYNDADGRRHAVEISPDTVPKDPPPECSRASDPAIPGRPQCPS